MDLEFFFHLETYSKQFFALEFLIGTPNLPKTDSILVMSSLSSTLNFDQASKVLLNSTIFMCWRTEKPLKIAKNGIFFPAQLLSPEIRFLKNF